MTCIIRSQNPNHDLTLVDLLRICAKKKDLRTGMRLHAHVLHKSLLSPCPYLGGSIVSMYAECGALGEARRVLQGLPTRDTVSWSALISGYARQGRGHDALLCFEHMQREGFSPNEVTFTCILKACGSIGAIERGEQIHDEIASRGLLNTNAVLGNALVDMYAKCGMLAKAQHVLDELPVRNVVSWSALIAGYSHHGQSHEAFRCFERMKREGVSPNEVTFACILKASGSIGSVEKGKEIHDEITRKGLLQKSMVLGNALVNMYAKCGNLERASAVLEELSDRNVVSWNALIVGYAQHDRGHDALNCYARMRREGFSPNEITFSTVLNACGKIGAVDKGKQIHDEIAGRGLLENNNVILGNALVDMYAKCGLLFKARQVLQELPCRNVATWSALITGYTRHEQGHEALDCFTQMQREGTTPNEVTFACVLKACGSIGAIDKGKEIHRQIVSRGLLRKHIVLGNALVDMYASCGDLTRAEQVLQELPVRDIVSWSSLVAGYAQHGNVCDVVSALDKMERQDGLLPNEVTFLSMLSGCSRSGKVKEAQMYYESMSAKYGITPKLEHHTCMVVVYGWVGLFDKVILVIEAMPTSEYSPFWIALLGCCRKWGKLNLAQLAFDQAMKVDDNLPAVYVVMANIYADAGMEADAIKIEMMRKKNDDWKKQADCICRLGSREG